MRRAVTDVLRRLATSLLGAAGDSDRRQRRRGGSRRRSEPPPQRDRPAAVDIDADRITFDYAPELDGEPDPGEVVWTWVPYEDDPSQGKDRPVVIVGRRGARLLGIPLTSKRHDHEPQVAVGSGAWDPAGRPSFAKLDRLLDVDPQQVRREGAILDRRRYDEVVDGVRRRHRRR
jgi:hypothetical protein